MKMKMTMVCLAAAMSLVAAAAKPAPKKAPAGAQRRAQAARPRPARPERRLAPGEQRLIDAIDEADSMRELSRLLPAARQSPNPDIRLAMVSALEDQERRAVNELVYFIADPNREVSEEAFDAWSDIVEDFDHPSMRVTAICQAAQILQAGAQPVPAAVPVAQPVPVVQPPAQVVQPAQVAQPVQVQQPAQVQQPVQVVAPVTP